MIKQSRNRNKIYKLGHLSLLTSAPQSPLPLEATTIVNLILCYSEISSRMSGPSSLVPTHTSVHSSHPSAL
jgi:hypothetical protein